MYGVRIHEKGSLDRGQLHTFVVMNAVFPAEASSFVTERFDLKGSTVGREASEEELERKGRGAVLKVGTLALLDANLPACGLTCKSTSSSF